MSFFKVMLAKSPFITVGLSDCDELVVKQATARKRVPSHGFQSAHSAAHWMQTRRSHEVCRRLARQAKSKAAPLTTERDARLRPWAVRGLREVPFADVPLQPVQQVEAKLS